MPALTRVRAGLAVLVLLVGPAAGAAAPQPPDREAALAVSRSVLGAAVADQRLVDGEGRAWRLSELRGRPLVINLVFTACTNTCPAIVQTLYRAVEAAQEVLGADAFRVVTLGFDARRDTPAQMRAYARQQGVDLPNWLFLSADQPSIEALTEDLGFVFRPSAQGFDHLAQTTILDPQGRVYRQIYGAAFAPPTLVEPLKTLAAGEAGLASVAGLVERVRLFCTLYDADSGRYRFDYAVFIAFGVSLTVLVGLASILLRAWIAQARRSRQRA